MGVATLEVDDRLDRASFLDELRVRREEFQSLRHIPQDVVDKFKKLGVYRALVPDQFGGAGWSARQFLELIEEISAADGSAGWVASFGFATKYISSLPPETLAEIYADGPDMVHNNKEVRKKTPNPIV